MLFSVSLYNISNTLAYNLVLWTSLPSSSSFSYKFWRRNLVFLEVLRLDEVRWMLSCGNLSSSCSGLCLEEEETFDLLKCCEARSL